MDNIRKYANSMAGHGQYALGALCNRETALAMGKGVGSLGVGALAGTVVNYGADLVPFECVKTYKDEPLLKIIETITAIALILLVFPKFAISNSMMTLPNVACIGAGAAAAIWEISLAVGKDDKFKMEVEGRTKDGEILELKKELIGLTQQIDALGKAKKSLESEVTENKSVIAGLQKATGELAVQFFQSDDSEDEPITHDVTTSADDIEGARLAQAEGACLAQAIERVKAHELFKTEAFKEFHDGKLKDQEGYNNFLAYLRAQVLLDTSEEKGFKQFLEDLEQE